MTPRSEWRALDPETRRAVQRNARQLRPHPDPRVAAVAERYARQAVLGARGRLRWTMAVIAGLAAGVGVSIGIWSPGVNAGVVTVATVLVVMAIAVVPVLRVNLLLKIEMANKMALAPAGAPAGAEGTPAPEEWVPAGRELAVRYNRGRVLRQLGPLFGMGCVFLVYGLLVTNAAAGARFLLVVFSSLLIALALLAAIRVLRWGLRRPILRLDAGGVHMPRYRYTLPWPEMAEVRLIPLRAFRRGRQPATIIAFVPADPQAAVRALRANGAGRRLEKSCRLYGTPLTLVDRMMDQPADRITAAATAWAPVPVRQY